MSDLVTICIPVFNMEGSISRAIKSALQQSYKNIEIIVLDNCSTDGTFEIATRYLGAGLRVERNAKNIGAYGNHNRCVELANGEWVKFLHGDDELLPECIQKMMEVKNFSPEGISLIACGAIHLGCGNRMPIKTYVPEKTIVVLEAGAKNILLAGNIIGTPTMAMVRRSDLIKYGWFDISMEPAADGEMWFRLLINSSAVFLNEHLVITRDDCGESISKRAKLQIKFFDQIFSQVEKIESGLYGIRGMNNSIINQYILNESVRFYDSAIIYLLKAGNIKLLNRIFSKMRQRKILKKSILNYFLTRVFLRGLNDQRKLKWPHRMQICEIIKR